MSWTVGEVARLTGVTVRTLHHYDAIGLVRPAMGQCLVPMRPVTIPSARLQGPAPSLRGAGGRRVLSLRRQHGLLRDRLARTQAMVAAVEKEMEARQMAIDLTPEERFEVFGDQDPAQYGEEVEARWGDSELLTGSRRRTAGYGRQDWLRINAEAADVEQRLAQAMRDGVPADAAPAVDLAEEHRQHIRRWFYDCSPEVHVALGRMYVEDARFTAHYEAVAPGLAQYLSAAVQANADRQG